MEMSQAEYARHRGVSRQMIGKLVGNGKIPAAAIVEKRDGTKAINAEAADLALGETIERVIARETAPPAAPETGDDAAAEPPTGAGAGLTKARTASAFYQANLARLQYEQRLGKLCDRADVEASMQRCAEALGRDVDQLASRTDDLVAAFTRDGVAGVRQVLKQISREIRATISKNMKLLAAADVEAADDLEDMVA